MNVEILRTNEFPSHSRRLAKKYPSFKNGKGVGVRVITVVKLACIYHLEIHDKSEKDSLSDKELYVLLKKVD